MKKEWFAAKELTGIAGLPSSPQGINLMAKREGWKQRRRRGVQGKAVEYHIDSLPVSVLSLLRLKEDPVDYVVTRQEPIAVWVEAYYQLTEAERDKIISFILREGIGSLMTRLAIT
ncbi:DNA-binding protein [Yersinia entomophaga]|uniref:DNA-binding protein n=2 Tax=Yersinia TaxID=629 RepID=A0ABN4Q062_YERET|nr:MULTISPECIES: DNA-binding protein [Yersinia]ANI30735.1 DNA-binding protein [Yersinia entomophaga]MDN0088552.1 DNA-binding protein [Yersinia nurmii]OWF88917.1 DNA-binding protein [Yersinia entomophaga]CNE78872.1 MuA-transposase/repressor protein CI DNA-binding [Yersinia nurmii]